MAVDCEFITYLTNLEWTWDFCAYVIQQHLRWQCVFRLSCCACRGICWHPEVHWLLLFYEHCLYISQENAPCTHIRCMHPRLTTIGLGLAFCMFYVFFFMLGLDFVFSCVLLVVRLHCSDS